MECRHSLGQPLMHTMDHEQIWNHPCRDPPLTIGSSSFMHPSENITVCGLNSEAYNNTPPTTCHPSLQNFNLEVPCYAAAHARIAEQPFIHSWSSCNSLQFQPYYIHSEPCPTQFHSGDVNVAVNPPTSFDTVTYKRKIPTVHFFSQNASSNSCLNAGRSSHAVSTELSEPTQPAEDPRTIRSHRVNAHQPGNISLPIHTSNSFSEHLQSVANTSILNVLAQWNHDALSLEPHTRLIPSGLSKDKPVTSTACEEYYLGD